MTENSGKSPTMKDIEDLSTYFDNLDALIEDDKKPVTYRWFAVEFCVQVNVAKKVLAEYYAKKHLKEKRPLFAKYCIGGNLVNSLPDVEQLGISVVDDDELEAARRKFSKVLFEHIYSIHKGKVSLENLTALDVMQQKDHPYSINKYSNLSNPTFRLHDGEPTPRPEPDSQETVPAVKSASFPAVQHSQEPQVDVSRLKKLSKGSLASAFAQQTSKKPAPKDHKEEAKPQVKEEPPKKKGTDMTAFFGKQAAKIPSPALETPVVPKLEETKKNPKRFTLSNSSSQPNQETPRTSESTSNGPTKSNKSTASTVSKPCKRAKKEKAPEVKKGQKRRRRIQEVSDSDSEPEREPEDSPMETTPPVLEESDDDIIPPTPIPVARTYKPGRKRVLKEVSRTYLDETGYIVTKKEYEAKSESDDEPTPIPAESKTEDPKPAPRAMSPPAKRKQASIMSFFNKKSGN